MEYLIQHALFLHIIVGSIALLAGGMAVFRRKGMQLHRAMGKVYFWAMTLVLPLSVANHFKNIESEIILDQSTSGIYGTNTDSLLVKNLEVNVGGVKAQIPVEFSALNKALLGNEFLKHFTVIINYDKKEIYLQKQREILIASPRKFSVAIENDSLWVVSRTTPELPLRLGDILLSVNGRKPQDLFASHCDYVMKVAEFLEQDSLVVQKKGDFYLNISIK